MQEEERRQGEAGVRLQLGSQTGEDYELFNKEAEKLVRNMGMGFRRQAASCK